MVKGTKEAAVIREINEATAEKNLPILGSIVWWSLTGVEVARDQIEQHVKDAGLPEAIVPRIEMRGALTKAMAALKTPLIVRRLHTDEDDERFSIALVREDVKLAALVDVEYQAEQVVTYERAAKTLKFKSSVHADEIRDLFTLYAFTFRAAEVRKVIQNALEGVHALTVREHGGIYFVPVQHQDVVAKLADLIECRLPACEFSSLAIVNSGETKRGMNRVAANEIKSEMDAAETDIKALLEKETVRGDTLKHRVAEYRRLREKALAYKELVGLDVAEIERKLGALQMVVEKLM